MNVEHLLGKLTPGGLVVENMASGNHKRTRNTGTVATGTATRSAKTSAITSADVAGALAGLDDRVYYYALAKFADDQAAANKFWGLFTGVALAKWPSVTRHQSMVLALLAMQGGIWAVRCKSCGGTKTRLNARGLPMDCKRCSGTGRNSVSGVKSARMLLVSESVYHKTWKDRIRRLETLLDEYESKALSHLANQFTPKRENVS
jgi:hypothetical protein